MAHRIGFPAFLPFAFALLAGCSDGPLAPHGRVAVASVAVSPTALALRVGASAALTARALDAGGAVLHGLTIDWTSTDTTVATVSASGLVIARGAGSAAIRAASGGRSGAVMVTVTDASGEELAVAWIQITPAGGLIPQAIGTSRQLGVVARALDGTEIEGRAVVWSSSAPAVASVGATGLLEAHAAGTTTITAVVDGKRDSTIVSVPTLIARIDTDPAELSLVVGDSGTIAATALDAYGSPLERILVWSSSNSAVATVDGAGRVVAMGAGTALITATSEGKNATTLVTVAGRKWRLNDVAGAPLPAILDTTTITADGVAREARFQVTDGTLRMWNGRYELRLHGWLVVDGAAPVRTTVASDGVVAYHGLTGELMLFEREDWWNQEPRFRGRHRADDGLDLSWSRQPEGPIVPLGFVR